MLSIALILVSVWALACVGVVVLCVAARRCDEEIAGERTITVTRAATRAPARALSRAVTR